MRGEGDGEGKFEREKHSIEISLKLHSLGRYPQPPSVDSPTSAADLRRKNLRKTFLTQTTPGARLIPAFGLSTWRLPFRARNFCMQRQKWCAGHASGAQRSKTGASSSDPFQRKLPKTVRRVRKRCAALQNGLEQVRQGTLPLKCPSAYLLVPSTKRI